MLAGCGTQSRAQTTGIERTFDVHWRDHASSTALSYTTRHIVFHAGRWSARISVHNGTTSPAYESQWEIPGSNHRTWSGPALVYSGFNVLHDRQLIFVPVDRATPPVPSPLPAGATWHGTISGKIPTAPPLPRSNTIWVRYPVFSIGDPYGPGGGLPPQQWISMQGIRL